MTHEFTITREIAPLPTLPPDAHKGDAGRMVVIGGSCNEVVMAGAPALTANAAFRSGIGLLQIFVPQAIRETVAVLSPCSTVRTLPTSADALLDAIHDFSADVVALGPGLGQSLDAAVVKEVLARFEGSAVVDADGLNLLSTLDKTPFANGPRMVITPHEGEAKRLLAFEGPAMDRRHMAEALYESYGTVVVLKGAATIVTNGDRLYTNETGNPGMATAGTGDVLTGVIGALIGQQVEPFEAAVLGVFLHGLAGDFAKEELGGWAVTAMDVIEYLPEAFCEHAMNEND